MRFDFVCMLYCIGGAQSPLSLPVLSITPVRHVSAGRLVVAVPATLCTWLRYFRMLLSSWDLHMIFNIKYTLVLGGLWDGGSGYNDVTSIRPIWIVNRIWTIQNRLAGDGTESRGDGGLVELPSCFSIYTFGVVVRFNSDWDYYWGHWWFIFLCVVRFGVGRIENHYLFRFSFSFVEDAEAI